jgi:hypothetical protein
MDSFSKEESQPQNGLEALREPRKAETSSDLASRLSGLRSMLSALGKQHQQQLEIPIEKATESEPQLAPVTDPSTNSAAVTLGLAPADLAGSEPVSDSRREANGSRSHRDRQESCDEVQTLPSWRGQYKNK